VGRHTPNNASGVPKGQLTAVRNRGKSVNAKAGLIGFREATNPSAKAWVSDMQLLC
jgi:hypothetical protein